jgi:Ca2+-binding RTX toxin-like protein
MSEQTTIAALGDQLFGTGAAGAMQAIGKTFELAFLKAVSQLSSPSPDLIVDQTGHIGVCREIANYKVASALSTALAGISGSQSDPGIQAVLNALSKEFSEFASAAGERIVNAAGMAGTGATITDALGRMFQAAPDEVSGLLAPAPGIDWSVQETLQAIQATISPGQELSDALRGIRNNGVDCFAQSMTDLSLGLEAAQRSPQAQPWHTIAGEAGAAALVLDSLFTQGNSAALALNGNVPFYQDPTLVGLVRDLMSEPGTDFEVVRSYLPEGQMLGLLVHAIDAGFTTAELNQLVDGVAADGVAAVQAILTDLRAVLTPQAPALSSIGGPDFYHAAFDTIASVNATYPSGLQLESLAALDPTALRSKASQSNAEGMAYRYALVELNGFALVGANYAPLNTDGGLNLYDSTTGRGAISLDYLADRPELLAAMLGANVRDVAPSSPGMWQVDGLNTTYVDRPAGLTMRGATAGAGVVMFDGNTNAPMTGTAGNDRLYGEEGDDNIAGGDGDDLLDGGIGDDILFGGAGKDLLRGGEGNDTLIGNGDGDVLEGGAGFDTYQVRGGDVVRDADGKGQIIVQRKDGSQTRAGGGVQVDGSQQFFRSTDGDIVYRENDDGSVDFWVDGQGFSVLPGDVNLAPRARRPDGAAPDDDYGDDGNLAGGLPPGAPALGLPLRRAGGPIVASYKAPFDAAQATPAPRRDPLVFDLDGDGFDTLGQSAVTYFDHDGNGFAELSGWVGGDDGLLVMDRNGNGRIDSGRELFGDQTVLASGAVATSGVQALAEWDSLALGGNGDGQIDASDKVWSKLQMWRDLDSDGFTDSGELFSLDQLGITGISLGFKDTGAGDGKGNQQARAGVFYRADGTQGAAAEYLLARTTAVSIAESNVALSADLLKLPDVRGSGNVYDLRQAMARDAGLQKLVTSFTQQTDAVARDVLLDQILFRWAGADGLRPDSRGDTIDARKLATLEQFLGQPFNGALGANPLPDAAVQLERAYQDLSEQVYGKLMVQTHLNGLYDSITYRWDKSSARVVSDLSKVTTAIDAQLAGSTGSGLTLLSEFARSMRALSELPKADYDTLRSKYAALGDAYAIAFDTGGLNLISDSSGNNRLLGTTGADSIIGSALGDTVMGFDGDDVIYGLDGDDTLSGCEDNDKIYGGNGDDNLFGGSGNDLLDGGAGSDLLVGGTGNDTYVLARGGGADLVRDYDTTPGNKDVIQVAAGLTLADVRYWREGNDLLVGITGTSDSLRVQDWFYDIASRVEEVVFADGRRLTADLLQAARFTGTAGDDSIQGSDSRDMLEGLAGNDVLFGGYGDDTLDGGAGNDVLYGGFSGTFDWAGSGNDTYIFARGYGQDTIYDRDTTPGNTDTVQLLGLNQSDVTLSRKGSDMVIAINGTTDTLTVSGWSDVANRIERVQFADGSVLAAADLADLPFLGTAGNDTLTGTDGRDRLLGLAGDDVIAGGFGDDVLDGGAGNDILYGGFSGTQSWAGAGNDTYVFARGYGRDAIYDYDTTPGNVDTVRLAGLNQSDVTLSRDTNNMYITINGTSDQLQVAGWGSGAAYRIERIEFADGSVLQGAALDLIPFLGTDGADTITATAGSDVIRGLGGNDTLYSGAGDDMLDGGTGNDVLFGGTNGYAANAGAGNDTYVFGRGYGSDTIVDYDTTPGNLDTILLRDLNAADVTLRRDANTFYVTVNGASDVLRVQDWGSSVASRVERLVFADGSVMDAKALAMVPYLGTAGADSITGTWDNEVMRGLGGNDTMWGGDGDDVLDGGDGDDNLKGEAGNDAVLGGAGNDLLYGGAGNDVLDGGTGDDRMYGSTGDDTYYVDSASDRLYEYLNEGIDTVVSSIDFTLADNFENLTLQGNAVRGTGNSAANVLRGNGLDNRLSGGAGDDYIDGGAGNDTMLGGTGNDTFVVDSAGDIVVENANEGIDTVRSSITYTLGDNVENLQLSGSGASNGTGNALANTITGNDAANVLSGGAGADVISGGGGNDTIFGGADADQLDGGLGDDVVNGDAGDDVIEGGSGYDVLRGGADNDRITDSAGGAVMDGGDGADTLVARGLDSFMAGGKGNDVIEAWSGANVIARNKGDGSDLLRLRGGDATLSLGGGTSRNDLGLRKDGNNLVLDLGGGETVTLEGWYDSTLARSNSVTLQMIEQAVSSVGASVPVPAPSIETFDFARLAAEFDKARAADPAIDRWTAMQKLLDTKLATLDGAVGGDMAYAYAMNGALGLSTAVMQDTLRAPTYGQQPQKLTPAALGGSLQLA